MNEGWLDGSTSVVMAVTSRYIMVANAGDSRAVLMDGNKVCSHVGLFVGLFYRSLLRGSFRMCRYIYAKRPPYLIAITSWSPTQATAVPFSWMAIRYVSLTCDFFKCVGTNIDGSKEVSSHICVYKCEKSPVKETYKRDI